MRWSSLLITLAIILASCGTDKSTNEKFDYPPALDIPTSELNLPVSIPLNDIEEILNAKLPKELVSGKAVQNIATADIMRNGRVELVGHGSMVKWKLPLRVIVKKAKNGNDLLNFALNLELDSKVDVNRDWNLVSQTEFKSIDWTEVPELKILFLKIDLSKFIEEQLWERETEICKQIDDEINSSVNLKTTFQKTWDKLQQPIRINKKLQLIWMVVKPESIGLRNYHFTKKQIVLNAQIRAKVATRVGEKPTVEALRPLSNLTSEVNDTDVSELYFHGELGYPMLNVMIDQKAEGKSIAAGDETILLEKIELMPYGKKLRLKVETSGDEKLKLVGEGVPSFNAESKVLQIGDFNYEVEEGSTLLAAGDFLFHDVIKDTVTSMLRLNLDSIVGELPALISKGIEKGKSGNMITMNIPELDVELHQMVIREEKVELILKGVGKAELTLDRVVLN